jgi:hypothetical protein
MKSLLLSAAYSVLDFKKTNKVHLKQDSSYYTYDRAREYLEYARIINSCDPETYDFSSNSLVSGFVLNDLLANRA